MLDERLDLQVSASTLNNYQDSLEKRGGFATATENSAERSLQFIASNLIDLKVNHMVDSSSSGNNFYQDEEFEETSQASGPQNKATRGMADDSDGLMVIRAFVAQKVKPKCTFIRAEDRDYDQDEAEAEYLNQTGEYGTVIRDSSQKRMLKVRKVNKVNDHVTLEHTLDVSVANSKNIQSSCDATTNRNSMLGIPRLNALG